jgi:hypothetical protein
MKCGMSGVKEMKSVMSRVMKFDMKEVIIVLVLSVAIIVLVLSVAISVMIALNLVTMTHVASTIVSTILLVDLSPILNNQHHPCEAHVLLPIHHHREELSVSQPIIIHDHRHRNRNRKKKSEN